MKLSKVSAMVNLFSTIHHIGIDKSATCAVEVKVYTVTLVTFTVDQ
jgi:hypothetical protein